MRTTARLLTCAALAAATIGLSAPGAHARDFESLEVFPSTAAPGATITVNTTACGRHGHGVGDARSLGAGEFHLSPGTHKETVVGQFRIPHGTQSGTYGISVRCNNGKRASGDVTVRHRSGDSAGHSGDHAGQQDDGQYQDGQYEQPSGHVRTGVGGSVGPDTDRIAAGVAVLAAAAVGGSLLLRRRASGTRSG
ncbi:hypothetical protein [Streptomyces sp. CAU 1734]|uniref:hypothetical protein n=1 Tax=Streptomyces sp. CAU 1734 TaxID=3140360 RepID=UPI00326132AF